MPPEQQAEAVALLHPARECRDVGLRDAPRRRVPEPGGYVGVPGVIGEGGVERIAEIILEAEDKAGFQKSVDAVHGLMAAAKVIAPDLA